MDWVKRNLAFVIGAAVSLVLLVLSGLFLYSNSKKNNEARDQLQSEYSELQRLGNLKPHPGKGKVDNVKRAREQKDELLQVMARVKEVFQPIPGIPSSGHVTGEEFSAELRRTLDYLNRLASDSSVLLPANYSFSFEAEKRLVKFAPGSLNPLATQLGEVKVISEILFDAKVNKLTGLRRERVSADDFKGPQTDYTTRTSTSNDLAVISPYEISFESFSAELGEVMTGFANSPHGLVVKGVNVRPASKTAGSISSPYGSVGGPEGIYEQSRPVYTAPAGPEGYAGAEAYPGSSVFAEGGRGGGSTAIRQPTFTQPFGGGEANPYGINQPRGGYDGRFTQPGARAYRGAAAPGTAAGASQTLIDEKPLSVTMVVEVIKMLPAPEE